MLPSMLRAGSSRGPPGKPASSMYGPEVVLADLPLRAPARERKLDVDL
jgi:hypothetical protein